MSTSLSVILKRLGLLFAAGAIVIGAMLLFSYDVIKVDWVAFMEIQPSFKPMEKPLPVPALSIPVEGPAYISSLGPPANPVPADDASIARGAELFQIHCTACHGTGGKGDGPVAPFLQNKKPVDLTGPIATALNDGAIFLTVSNGTPGGMPALNENLTVRERWDVVNYVRTLQQK